MIDIDLHTVWDLPGYDVTKADKLTRQQIRKTMRKLWKEETRRLAKRYATRVDYAEKIVPYADYLQFAEDLG